MPANEATIKIKVVAFGIARDIIGGSSVEIHAKPGLSVKELQELLLHRYPQFTYLSSLRIALNQSYAKDDQVITESDEIVLIPPVCGG
jgi:molybdopterin synthase sulfur carrier subunit